MNKPHPGADNESSHPSWTPEMPGKAPTGVPHVWPSASLLRGQKTVAIEHNGSVYRLQSTRAGKLILTK